MEIIKFTKTDPQSERLDAYLAMHTAFSRSTIQKMIKQARVLVNGNPAKNATILVESDQIELHHDDSPKIMMDSQNSADFPVLEIVYEDDYLAVINKPAGLTVHPSESTTPPTLVDLLPIYFKVLSDFGDPARRGVVHRLDKFTEGLMLIAKDNQIHSLLTQQFKNREICKKYYAVIGQEVAKDEFEINLPIGRDPKNRQKFKVISDPNIKSRDAYSFVKVINRQNQKTLVEVEIKSGRTHQIRVHLRHVGYPILGDPIYTFKKQPGTGQLLQSFYLSFVHPITQQPLEFVLPLAPRLAKFFNQIH